MAGFTGFPFSYNTSPSSSSTSSSASSAGAGSGIPSFGAASSIPSFGSTPFFGAPSFTSPFGPSPNGFPFSTTPSNNPSMPSNNNSTPTNDEATINKILEAIEVLEKLAKTGAFPQEKLDEIKKELEKKYPNIFKTKKPAQNNTNNTNNTNSTLPNNDPLGWENHYANLLNQQQEFWKNYQNGYQNIQQQVNQQIQAQVQAQMQAQKQMMEQYMKMYSTSGTFSPNYFGNNSYNYPGYNNINNSSAEAWKMAFEMIGKTSNDGLFNNVLGNNTGFGTDGFSALSFLGSLLGGGFGF